jgi:hypothetical protein
MIKWAVSQQSVEAAVSSPALGGRRLPSLNPWVAAAISEFWFQVFAKLS